MDSSRRHLVGLGAFFAVMYFVQSLGDPSSGIIAQPLRSLLKSWEFGAAEIGMFMAVVGLPWTCKPVFGLLSDFVPIFGSRRRLYLLLATSSSALGFTILAGESFIDRDGDVLLLLLMLPAVGVAFGDVLIDGLMIDEGQPRGLTGVLQSVQWTAAYAAMMVTGVVGGYFSQIARPDLAFALCAVLWGVSLMLALLFATEPAPSTPLGLRDFGSTVRGVFATPGLIPVAAFLFLWNFNPLWPTVLYVHLTDELLLSELVYGQIQTVFSAGALLGAILYPWYCRRVALGRLLHAAIAAGVLGNAIYLAIAGVTSGMLVAFTSGIAYMTGTMIQLDIAARRVPLVAAASVFALLMALSNLSTSLSEAGGAWVYEAIMTASAPTVGWVVVVLLSAGAPALCWFLVSPLNRAGDTRVGMSLP